MRPGRPDGMREGRIVQCVRALVFVTALVLSGDNVLAQQAAQMRARVGVVLDGDSEATREILSAYRDEIMAFFGADHGIEFDERAVVAANWTAPGARAAIDRLFADPRVDVVLALGPIGSNELARRATHVKPAIAAAVVDGRLQQLPLRDGASGVPNLTYIDAASSTTRMLEQFRTVVPFRSLGILVNEGLPEAIPALREAVESQSSAANVVAHIIPVASSGVAALAGLSTDVDAVYLGPLDRLPAAAYDSLLSTLQQRGLPAFTVLGRPGVERGALAAFAPRDDLERRARRVAVDLQRILSGEDAGTLPVGLAAIPELTLNMATARAIGFAPEWQVLIEADLINQEPPAEGRQWSIATAAREAMRMHSDVRAAEYDVAAGSQEVRRARSALLPQLSATTTGSLVRESTAAASFGQQPERSLTGSLNLTQVLISDDARAAHKIAGFQQEGRVAVQQRTQLDVALDAGIAYLDVLRARAQSRVQHANLRRTRANFELAQLREITGAAGLGDVYRWQSELANARRAVLDADAQLSIASTKLNRMLERPLEEPFTVADATPADSSFITSEARLFDYIGNGETFRVFRDFMVGEALSGSPELRELDAGIAAQKRSRQSAARKQWWPTLSLQAGLTSAIARGGAGTNGQPFPPDASPAPDESWSVRLQLSRPLFTGFEQEAAKEQADLQLERLTFVRRSTERSIAQQMLSALHLASASWPSIRQARESAEAAQRNLELMTDAYSRGAVAVISLIDAQQAALNADVSAADATYTFLTDLMRVERAAGEFHFFRSPSAREGWIERLDAFFRAAGVNPVPTHQ